VNAPQVDFQPFEPDMPDFQGMMEQQAADYQNQLAAMRAEQAAAAEEYRRQAEEQRRQFELQQRTMIGNEARAGQQASFQLGGAPGMKRGGTFGFRRRRRSLMGGIGASGLAGAPASANTGGTLNV
jgi:flagellar biosynthesis/type III secretory pathway protein FliH